MARWHAIGMLDKLTAGEIHSHSIEGTRIVVTRAGDTVSAFLDVCPHEGHPLSEGTIEDDVIVCAKHLWEFDIGTGVHVSRVPKPQFDLKRLPVRITGERRVEVEMPA